MTEAEYQLIADVLRHRINEITKMFKPPGTHVPEAEAQLAMKVQVLILAQELEHAFYQRDRTLDGILETNYIHSWVGKRRPQSSLNVIRVSRAPNNGRQLCEQPALMQSARVRATRFMSKRNNSAAVLLVVGGSLNAAAASFFGESDNLVFSSRSTRHSRDQPFPLPHA